MAVSVELERGLQEKLNEIARRTERTKSQCIRLAIKRFLEKDGNSTTKKSQNI